MNVGRHSDLLFNTNWKTLLVLDACRFDFFAEVVEKFDIEGDLSPVDSEANTTPQWYSKHFQGDFKNTVLVSSSPAPWCYEIFGEVPERFTDNFFQSYEVAKEIGEKDSLEWQEPSHTIDVYKRKRIDEKRTLVHFIPPHLPYLGEQGSKFFEVAERGTDQSQITPRVEKWARENSWERLEEYYEENISYVLQKIGDNLRDFHFPVIITSDHGEFIGERNRYGHHRDWDHPAQRLVPWMGVEEDTA